MANDEQSERVPGYRFRPIDADAMTEQGQAAMEKLEIHDDGELGIPVRTAKAEDIKHVGETGRPTPLE